MLLPFFCPPLHILRLQQDFFAVGTADDSTCGNLHIVSDQSPCDDCTVSDDSAARAESLKAAVAAAKEKAAILADAAGMGELEIESIQESNVYSFDSGVNNFSRKTYGAVEEAAMDSPTVVRAAKICVTATVTVTFKAK